MLVPRFELKGLEEDKFASVEGDDAPAQATSKDELAAQLRDLETSLVVGHALITTTAAAAGRLLEVLSNDVIPYVTIQLRDEVSAAQVENLRDVAATLLDRGVSAVLLPADASTAADVKATLSGLPVERVGAVLALSDIKSIDGVELMKGLNSTVGSYLVTVQGDVSLVDEGEQSPQAAIVRDLALSAVRQLAGLARSGRSRRLMISLPGTKPSVALVAKLEKLEIGLVVESADIEFSNAKGQAGQQSGKAINLTDSFVGCLVTDRSDGLFATVVVDEQGVALGLAYSSHESIREAVQTRQGVYHSRSRGLWYKGLTSGATQVLYRIEVDCDKDALRFTVHQNEPGYCHLNTRTCFGPDKGITALVSVLQSRKSSAPAGSYTRRLFEDETLLHSKIMEEAEELCEAKDQDHVAAEAADLIYFALTKCVKSGVGLTDIERHLDMRSRKISRRPGNAKPKWSSPPGAGGAQASSVPESK